MNNELPQIYCDMDEVLVNFMDGANKALAAQGLGTFKETEKDVIWEALNKVPKFWANLDPMPDAMRLWRYIKPHQPHILSTPSKHMVTCKPEKNEWIRKHLGNVEQVNLVPRENKQTFAVNKDGTPNLLIDDYEKNIKEWVAKGGIGIRHINSMNTISQLRKIGY
jgi:5'(3')-deoxyribonucleotidase